MKTICVFTGTRAEYGLLKPLIRILNIQQDHKLVILTSGTHLSPEFGKTVSQIEEKDAVYPVEMLLSSDSDVGLAKSFGLGVIGLADALNRIRPEYCIIAGDRYEALAAASTCVMLSIPVVHIHGGEISNGSLDEYFRHAISKLSGLHFTSTEEYRKRVIQLGENPATVFNTGAIGLDNLQNTQWMCRDELETDLSCRFMERNYLITYHPAYAKNLETVKNKTVDFLRSMENIPQGLMIFTKANADAGGRIVNQMLADFVSHNSHRARLYDSLGVRRYFSLMKHSDVVIGNSSSGIIEAPSLGIPTVNVGNRQDGRIKAESILDCSEENVKDTVVKALSRDFRSLCSKVKNPYGDGSAAKKMWEILASYHFEPGIKKFYDKEYS